MASRINLFRRKVAAGQYELTGHANSEMEQDGFTVLDVKSCIYSDGVVSTQRHGSSPRKDVVEGKSSDERRLRVICRLTGLGRLRIITVFAVEKS